MSPKSTLTPGPRPDLDPLLTGTRLFLSDGGLETFLIFHRGVELPVGEAYTLLQSEEGTEEIRSYFEPYLALAARYGTGFVLESPTWRANPDWAAQVGTSPAELDRLNRRAIELLCEIRERHSAAVVPIVVSGCIGPRSDAYRPSEIMSEDEAAAYHAPQVESLRAAGADLVSGFTLTNLPEAIGLTRAAQAAGVPCVVSFTVETDGRLPTGPTLREAIERVDEATGRGPAYYMVNCAHPSHVEPALADLTAGGGRAERLRGLRANSSSRSHAELDESPELDEGDPPTLGDEYRRIRERHPHITVLGGCCGTDHRHITEIARACIVRR